MKIYYLFAFASLFALTSYDLYGVSHDTVDNQDKLRKTSFKTTGKKDTKKSVEQRRIKRKFAQAKAGLARINKEDSSLYPFSYIRFSIGLERNEHSSSLTFKSFQDDFEVDAKILDEIEANYYALKSNPQQRSFSSDNPIVITAASEPVSDDDIYNPEFFKQLDVIEESYRLQKSNSSQGTTYKDMNVVRVIVEDNRDGVEDREVILADESARKKRPVDEEPLVLPDEDHFYIDNLIDQAEEEYYIDDQINQFYQDEDREKLEHKYFWIQDEYLEEEKADDARLTTNRNIFERRVELDDSSSEERSSDVFSSWEGL